MLMLKGVSCTSNQPSSSYAGMLLMMVVVGCMHQAIKCSFVAAKVVVAASFKWKEIRKIKKLLHSCVCQQKQQQKEPKQAALAFIRQEGKKAF